MHYILDDKNNPVQVDWETHGKWFFSHDREVKLTRLPEGLIVSTVFVGVSTRRPPKVFETLVLGDGESYTVKSATWDEALEAHDEIVRTYQVRFN